MTILFCSMHLIPVKYYLVKESKGVGSGQGPLEDKLHGHCLAPLSLFPKATDSLLLASSPIPVSAGAPASVVF